MFFCYQNSRIHVNTTDQVRVELDSSKSGKKLNKKTRKKKVIVVMAGGFVIKQQWVRLRKSHTTWNDAVPGGYLHRTIPSGVTSGRHTHASVYNGSLRCRSSNGDRR